MKFMVIGIQRQDIFTTLKKVKSAFLLRRQL